MKTRHRHQVTQTDPPETSQDARLHLRDVTQQQTARQPGLTRAPPDERSLDQAPGPGRRPPWAAFGAFHQPLGGDGE